MQKLVRAHTLFSNFEMLFKNIVSYRVNCLKKNLQLKMDFKKANNKILINIPTER
jgi:hypothetical protein